MTLTIFKTIKTVVTNYDFIIKVKVVVGEYGFDYF